MVTVACIPVVRVRPRSEADTISTVESRVAEAAVLAPKILPPGATVADVRELFRDDHVHAALVVEDGLLVTVIVREDLTGRDSAEPALAVGRLVQRTVDADADLVTVHRSMVERGLRRLAVVRPDGSLVGLLALKRSGRGFCSDADIASRAADPHCHV